MPELMAGLDPLFDFGPAPPPGQRRGLNYQSCHRISRWMIEPADCYDSEIRLAMVADNDVSLSGTCMTLFNFFLIAAVNVWIDPTAAIRLAAGTVFICGALRLAALFSLLHMSGARQGRATDLYLVTTLTSFITIGIMSGISLASDKVPMQIIAAASIPAVQGLLIARNYAAPRFAWTLLISLNVPLIVGCICAADHWLWLIVVVTPIFVLGWGLTIRRFHAVSIARFTMQRQSQIKSLHDPLTGALNRFGLMHCLHDWQWDGNTEIALFYLDLDGFKLINDHHGHLAGDSVLRLVADRLRAVSRPQDHVARLGGDEFVIAVSGIAPAMAAPFATRIIAAIGGTPYPLPAAQTVTVGVSVGFACAPADSRSIPELLKLADLALYKAKSNGRGVWQRG